MQGSVAVVLGWVISVLMLQTVWPLNLFHSRSGVVSVCLLAIQVTLHCPLLPFALLGLERLPSQLYCPCVQ